MSEIPSDTAAKPVKIPEDIKTLADACSLHFRGTNRLWLFAAALSLAVIAGLREIAGIALPENWFYPVAAFVLALVNLAFCVEYLQAHRTHKIFIDWLEASGADKDAAHALYSSSLIRLNPITHFLPEWKWLNELVKGIKLIVDLIFYAIPVFGCFKAAELGGLFQIFGLSGAAQNAPWSGWAWLFAILFLVTALASLRLVFVGFAYFGRGGYGTD